MSTRTVDSKFLVLTDAKVLQSPYISDMGILQDWLDTTSLSK